MRYVGNVSTGRMALELARAALRRRHRVTLFLADSVAAPRSRARIRRFVSAGDLRDALRAAAPSPDLILHAAAVSDYAPSAVRGKVESGRARWQVELRPLPKIVAELRRRHPRAILCMFKLESGIGRPELVRRALAAGRKAGADLVFANRMEEVGKTGSEHRGLLIDPAAPRAADATIAATKTRAEAARAIVAHGATRAARAANATAGAAA